MPDLELVADLGLGATRDERRHDVGERGIGDPACLGHASDLAGVLGAPLGLDDPPMGTSVVSNEPLELQELLVA